VKNDEGISFFSEGAATSFWLCACEKVQVCGAA